MKGYAIGTVIHGAKDGDGVKNTTYGPGEEMDLPPEDMKALVSAGQAVRSREDVEKVPANPAVGEIGRDGARVAASVKTVKASSKKEAASRDVAAADTDKDKTDVPAIPGSAEDPGRTGNETPPAGTGDKPE